MTNLQLYIATNVYVSTNSIDSRVKFFSGVDLFSTNDNNKKDIIGTFLDAEKGCLYKHKNKDYEARFKPEYCPDLISLVNCGEEYYLRTGDALIISRKSDGKQGCFLVQKT